MSYYEHIREDIFPYLPEKCTRLLEIGCSNGNTVRKIKTFKNIEYACGVEISPQAANEAENVFDAVFCGAVEGFDFSAYQKQGKKFDVILALDVLEHLVDPWDIVRKLSDLLVDGGVLIASLPNIRHRSVLKDLIFRNRFEYADAGILDRTHLRFFVRNTAIELCEVGGLKVGGCYPSKKLKGKAKLLSMLTGGITDDFYIGQFILPAQKT